MLSSRRIAAAFAATLLVALAAQFALGRKKDASGAASQMDAHKRALHALNRLTFGPRPGDVERVTATGVDKWIDQQLHPEKIDDAAAEARLAPFRTLHMSTREIVENFPPPIVIKAVAEGKLPMPRDSSQRAIYEAQVARYREKAERKEKSQDENPAPQAASSGNTSANANMPDNAEDGADPKLDSAEMQRRRSDRLAAYLESQELLDLPPEQRMKKILSMTPDQQRVLAASLKGRGEEVLEGMSPQQRETLMALYSPQLVVAAELSEAKLLRAVYSERQLQEVMTDFWFNHFNVFIGKRTGSLPGYQLRARCHPAARVRQVQGLAGGHGEESGDAVLSGQLAERRPGFAPCPEPGRSDKSLSSRRGIAAAVSHRGRSRQKQRQGKLRAASTRTMPAS